MNSDPAIPRRRRARILAMQALCQAETLRDDFVAQLDEFLADEGDPPDVQAYARGLVRGVWETMTAVDERITASAERWDVARMAMVDRNILRVAVYELLDRPDVPPKAAIDEAIEIAKVFGAAESPGFVNGVLDDVRRRLEAGRHAAEPPHEPRDQGIEGSRDQGEVGSRKSEVGT